MERFLLRLRGWIEAAHPFPLAAVLLLTLIVALASGEGREVDAGRLGLVLLAMLLSQLAIGWTNDYADRESDRRHQPSKPVAMGRVDARQMPFAITVALVGSMAFGVVLGVVPLLFLLIGTAAGLSYDLWLRQSRWSWLTYVVALAVLPPFVWAALDLYRDELLAGYAIALPLAPAAHIANVLPDVAADAASGRRNLTVIWGRGRSLWVLGICLVVPLGVVAASLVLIDYELAILGPGIAVYAALVGAAAGCYRQRADSTAFKLVVAASVVFVGGWLAAV